MCGKKFSIYGVNIPRKCIESRHFYSCPSPQLKTPSRKKLLSSCFPQDERGVGNCDLLYQNSIRKYEDDLEH